MINNNDEKLNISLKDNDTLLISEIQNKVILPYTAEEIKKILENEGNIYNSAQEVIEKLYTKPLDNYRFQFWSRYNETIKLMTEREHYRMVDAVTLGLEVLPIKYLYPAIITACKNLNELNVYLDCLEKDELDDFKIFNIKYEIYPMVVKEQNSLFAKTRVVDKIISFLKKILSKFLKFQKDIINKIEKKPGLTKNDIDNKTTWNFIEYK